MNTEYTSWRSSMFSLRVLRRRWVLAVILLFSATYFLTSIYRRSNSFLTQDDYKPIRPIPIESFRWQPRVDPRNATKINNCRNSVQGRLLIADDRGYVCERQNVLLGGCCNTDALSTRHFICDSCFDNGCCSLYEHCVSCCLNPDKQPLLRRILGKAADSFNQLFASVTDHFELCLTKCRTSSLSVQHENSYRDPKAKYCYGEEPPELQPGV